MKKIYLAIIVLILLLCMAMAMPQRANAANPQVHITVAAFIVGTPSGLTLTIVNDSQIDISWINGIGAVNTMLRVKYGSAPVDRNDGMLLYSGSGTSFTDNNFNSINPNMPFYRAWSQNAMGIWEPIGITKEAIHMLIAEVVWFFLWIALYIGIVIISYKTRFWGIALIGFVIWTIVILWTNTKVTTGTWLDIWYIVRILSVTMLVVHGAITFGVWGNNRPKQQMEEDDDVTTKFFESETTKERLNRWRDSRGRTKVNAKED